MAAESAAPFSRRPFGLVGRPMMESVHKELASRLARCSPSLEHE